MKRSYTCRGANESRHICCVSISIEDGITRGTENLLVVAFKLCRFMVATRLAFLGAVVHVILSRCCLIERMCPRKLTLGILDNAAGAGLREHTGFFVQLFFVFDLQIRGLGRGAFQATPNVRTTGITQKLGEVLPG